MEPKYPVVGIHSIEYLVLHALEKGERSVRNIRHCISEDTKPVKRWVILTGSQVSAALQRLAKDGLVEHRSGASNLWQLTPNEQGHPTARGE